jgi:hypothetical protein
MWNRPEGKESQVVRGLGDVWGPESSADRRKVLDTTPEERSEARDA